jgi:Acetyltransferase (GNAT) domain
MNEQHSIKFRVEEISVDSEYLETIINLGNTNAKTLGFLPFGAFHDLAKENRILGCIASDIGCVGYLLYGINRRHCRVRITHLCVDTNWRNRGIAKLLIDKLKIKTKHLNGILLSCRRDYNLHGMWSALGFVARNEKPGKSKKGSILTQWWLDYGHDNLLTNLTYQITDSKLCVAIDANIFFDLVENEKIDEESNESRVLIADWLDSEIELCLTDEINNEINRNPDGKKREKLRTAISHFTLLPCIQQEFDKICQDLRRFFPEKMKPSDASDMRQIARVITSQINTPYFITRDKRLLEEIEEEIYQEFNLIIIDPINFIIKLDELRRETEYQPQRLVGTDIEEIRVQSGELDSIVDLFLDYSQGERKTDFSKKIRHFLSNTNQFKCFTVGKKLLAPIALIVYDRTENEELKIPIFRFRNSNITPTILRRCIFQCFSISASENRQFTRITENFLNDETINSLLEDRFFKIEDGWLRANLAISQNAADVSYYLDNLCKESGKGYEQYLPIVDALANLDLLHNPEIMADIERMLYPAKITDADVPTFIIPIQSWWAKDLFDQELASEVLWGAKEEIALKREVVYYCAKRAMQAPGRILWYVSKSGTGKNSSHIVGAIRACSHIDEIVIGKPKDLYKRFRRLGVYSFQDVIKTADNNLDKNIMAVKFSDTELFTNPIKLADIIEIVGRRISVQSSSKITSEEFKMLYNVGKQMPI